jgi:hypothetical protein
MKIQLIDSRPGVVKAIILKEWMRIGLSICLLGLPVILGYLSIQIGDARNAEFAKDSPTPALGDEFDFSGQVPEVQDTTLGGHIGAGRQLTQESHGVSGELKQNSASLLQLAVMAESHWSREQQNTYQNGPATVKHQALALFAKYGDVLKKGQITVLAAVIGYAPESYPGFAIHKNGRVIDPASYIHSTIR